MKKTEKAGYSRRSFLNTLGLAAFATDIPSTDWLQQIPHLQTEMYTSAEIPTVIGTYGHWAATIAEDPPTHSFRKATWQNLEAWRIAARERFLTRIAQPDTGTSLHVTVDKQYAYNGLHFEELSWQLPYGNPTKAVLLKPEGAQGKLPAVLALHDHGGDKMFGWQKIVRTGEETHPWMVRHHERLYGGTPWAGELAKRGYVVLVPDAFAFGSRRVLLENIPEQQRNGLSTATPEEIDDIAAYNQWAGAHEHILAKSLFCAGTTWPGVFLGEDQRALDILCARPDVDANRVGCGGLSGGGLRTVFLGGADKRIKCAVCVGMMTTWKDYLVNKSVTHTWMVYVPLLPRELDYPEILGLRVPLPTLVQNNRQDQLFTLPEMERADKILQAVYDKAEAADRYRCSFYNGPHKFDVEMQAEAFEWFDAWL